MAAGSGARELVGVEDSGVDLGLTSTVRDRPCSVSVEVVPNRDPGAVGSPPHAAGCPMCTATITTELTGYDAVMGWIQVVGTRTGDEAPFVFELDPLEIFVGLDVPFGTHGVTPVLFDAPSRRDRTVRLSWRAHSFLCVSEPHAMSRDVVAVAAFEWGFEMGSDEVAVVGPSRLGRSAWLRQVPLLATSHPGWTFEPGDDAW